MRRLVLLPVLALALLAGCTAAEQSAENASADYADNADLVDWNVGEAANATMPGNVIARETDAYCPAVDYVTSAAQCRRFTDEKATLDAGLGVFNPPRQMVVGESRDLVLAVGRKADSAEVHEAVGGNESQHVEVRTPVGHFMTATLSGGGFDISPQGPQPKTLAADRSEAWQWRITARDAGPQKLLLTISVDATAPDGTRSRYDLARKPIDIDVAVTDAQRREDNTKRLEDKIGHGTRVLGALEKWLIALAAVLAAAGGVWIAIRTFGKGKDKGKDDGAGKPG